MDRNKIIRIAKRIPLLVFIRNTIIGDTLLGGVSTRYKKLDAKMDNREIDNLAQAWKSSAIPAAQRNLVERQIQEYRNGGNIPVYDALVDILRENIEMDSNLKLLEIGCSSGYYSEVFKIKGIDVNYTGCDFSDAFINMAKEKYPDIEFDVEDATKLSYPNDLFDVVVSGCCILHIPNYKEAIKEAARVARSYVVFHRTPVLAMSGPIMYQKNAYKVQTVEIHFNEQLLIREFHKSGLDIIDVNCQSNIWQKKVEDSLATKTYLCRKVSG